MLIRCLAVLGGVLVGFSLHTALHVDPSVVALLGAGVLVLVSGTSSDEFLEDVEWETLVFFAGLFVMVGSLVNVGVIEYLGQQAVEAVDGRYLLASTGLLFGSAVISGIVDNIPYVATMSPLVDDLVQSGGGTRRQSRCGGRWPSAPISAATRRPWARAPTSSSPESPHAAATRSRSGTSPSTAWSSPP